MVVLSSCGISWTMKWSKPLSTRPSCVSKKNNRRRQFCDSACNHLFIMWRFPETEVPLNHPILVVFSLTNHLCWGTPINGNPHVFFIQFVAPTGWLPIFSRPAGLGPVNHPIKVPKWGWYHPFTDRPETILLVARPILSNIVIHHDSSLYPSLLNGYLGLSEHRVSQHPLVN